MDSPPKRAGIQRGFPTPTRIAAPDAPPTVPPRPTSRCRRCRPPQSTPANRYVHVRPMLRCRIRQMPDTPWRRCLVHIRARGVARSSPQWSERSRGAFAGDRVRPAGAPAYSPRPEPRRAPRSPRKRARASACARAYPRRASAPQAFPGCAPGQGRQRLRRAAAPLRRARPTPSPRPGSQPVQLRRSSSARFAPSHTAPPGSTIPETARSCCGWEMVPNCLDTPWGIPIGFSLEKSNKRVRPPR